jgi:hypothetical protein
MRDQKERNPVASSSPDGMTGAPATARRRPALDCVFIFMTAKFSLVCGKGHFSCAAVGEWSVLRLLYF